MKTTVIRPCSRWGRASLGKLWEYRELFLALVARDIKVRYRQTVLGALWAVLQPVTTMLVFWAVFGRLVHVPSEGYPYPLFVLVALLPWLLFANAVAGAGNSLIGSASLVTKIYFPRLIIPLSSLGANLLDFAVSFVVLSGMLWYYGIEPGVGVLWVPVLIVGVLILITGLGCLLSALSVAYRDFRYVIPFLMQVWLFATPVIYPSSIVPEQFRWALFFNPMAGFVEGFRSAVLGRPFDWPAIALSATVAVVLFAAGIAYFGRVERRLTDII